MLIDEQFGGWAIKGPHKHTANFLESFFRKFGIRQELESLASVKTTQANGEQLQRLVSYYTLRTTPKNATTPYHKVTLQHGLNYMPLL